MNSTVWIILASALATYLTRVGGNLVLSRFETVHPRIEGALNAVPAAVLTALFAPALLSAGPKEIIAMLFAAIVALRFGLMTMFVSGAAMLILLRNFA
ncbi:MAG: AzlD family protein [Rhizobiaceae bacterium]|nr:AzlD family protein [Rhizobiaceae bacterium]